VVVAGDLDKSRLWDLVGKQDPIKMPMGEARITRTNWENLRTWILEGAKFDGDDPRAPLRGMVPAAGDRRASELATLTVAEFAAMRRERAKAQWEKTLPKTVPAKLESDDFVIYGDVPEARLQQVAGWASEQAGVIEECLGKAVDSTTLFKGGLAIFLVRDRFSFNEFHIELQGRPAPSRVNAFSRVTGGQEDANVVLQDAGDEVTPAGPGLKQSLLTAMTEAAFQRSASTIPDWLATGTAVALAAASDPRNAHYQQLRGQGNRVASLIAKPEDVYTGRGLTPEQSPAAAFTFVEFLIQTGGKAKFQEFIRAVHGGAEAEKAAAQVYGVDLHAIAQQFVASRKK
jgi:hypothetical protein